MIRQKEKCPQFIQFIHLSEEAYKIVDEIYEHINCASSSGENIIKMMFMKKYQAQLDVLEELKKGVKRGIQMLQEIYP